MAAVTEDTAAAVKRKRSQAKEKASKRARSASSDEDAQGRILLLENEVFESKKNYNNISTLITIVRSEDVDSGDSIFASIALCRVFIRLMVSEEFTARQSNLEKDAVVILWLRERYSEYKRALIKLLGRRETSPTTLTLCMRLLKSEGTYLKDGIDYSFPARFLYDIVDALLVSASEESVVREFSEKYVEEFDDIRYYTFSAINKLLSEANLPRSDAVMQHALDILAAIESVPETKDELEDFYVPPPKSSKHTLYSLTAHKKNAQATWLSFMRLNMEKERRKQILRLMRRHIAPWFLKPELLMDFLTDSYDVKGSTSLLALEGVFYLIQERNLDYPAFYLKLYSILDSGLLHSKHRSKFLRLLDTFLASTHLPAVLVASFIKKLSRLALFAPPAGIVAVVPFIYNLLKKHPACTFMIHREVLNDEAKLLLEDEGMKDPFSMEEEDPMETNAIESSLWEVVMLQTHYHPNVATLSKIISEQFTKHSYSLEDFLDHSYGSMLEAELSMEMKKIPVVEFEIPKKILFKHDVESGTENSLLVKLWDFK